jgi:hypothetical protein
VQAVTVFHSERDQVLRDGFRIAEGAAAVQEAARREAVQRALVSTAASAAATAKAAAKKSYDRARGGGGGGGGGPAESAAAAPGGEGAVGGAVGTSTNSSEERRPRASLAAIGLDGPTPQTLRQWAALDRGAGGASQGAPPPPPPEFYPAEPRRAALVAVNVTRSVNSHRPNQWVSSPQVSVRIAAAIRARQRGGDGEGPQTLASPPPALVPPTPGVLQRVRTIAESGEFSPREVDRMELADLRG